MHEQSTDHATVHRYVAAIREQLRSDKVTATERTRQAFAQLDPDPAQDGDVYMARDPLVSLVQSSLDEALGRRAPGRHTVWTTIVAVVRGLLHPGSFTPTDPDWVTKVAEATFGHLARGNHPFTTQPAEHAISDDARVVVVGDWGTGLPLAQAVATHMASAIEEALRDHREVHVVHLGDVYYSGLPSEYERRFLAYWPVTPEQAEAGVTSWSLNGNHDMYSGGFGYFQTMLADPRFARQHSADGSATSWFRLTSPSWDLVGLDTSWSTDVLSKGNSAVLHDPQAEYVTSTAAASSRKLALLSHHQYVSTYDPSDIGKELPSKLAPVLEQERVTAWWWGHEHRCMGFEPYRGVRFPRCLGHGGVPNRAKLDPITPPGSWEAQGTYESGGRQWGRFGFMTLDLDGDRITARYVDDGGACVREEEIA